MAEITHTILPDMGNDLTDDYEIKPCPFCGGKSVLRRVQEYHSFETKCFVLENHHDKDCFFSYITKPTFSNDSYLVDYDPQHLVEIWNRRYDHV